MWFTISYWLIWLIQLGLFLSLWLAALHLIHHSISHLLIGRYQFSTKTTNLATGFVLICIIFELLNLYHQESLDLNEQERPFYCRMAYFARTELCSQQSRMISSGGLFWRLNPVRICLSVISAILIQISAAGGLSFGRFLGSMLESIRWYHQIPILICGCGCCIFSVVFMFRYELNAFWGVVSIRPAAISKDREDKDKLGIGNSKGAEAVMRSPVNKMIRVPKSVTMNHGR